MFKNKTDLSLSLTGHSTEGSCPHEAKTLKTGHQQLPEPNDLGVKPGGDNRQQVCPSLSASRGDMVEVRGQELAEK